VVELASAPRRVAVVQTAGLAEVIFVSPLVRVVKLAWPNTHLTFVARPEHAALAACVPGVDAVIAWSGGLGALGRTVQALAQPDLVLAAHTSFDTALLSWRSGAPVRVGFEASVLGRFFTVQVPVRAREPFVEQAMDLARALGVEGPTDLELKPPPAEAAHAQAELGGVPSVGLLLDADWPTRRWPAQSFARLAQRLAADGLRPVLLGGVADAPFAKAVSEAATGCVLLDLVGRPLVESLATLAGVKAAVGGDSVLGHASRALGVPTLMMFGPTDPGMHTLENHAQAIRLGLDCQPCGDRATKACPLKHHDCLRQLEVERVASALASLTARRGARP
jgi:ADP-heptose:LPS heptosyltransferase